MFTRINCLTVLPYAILARNTPMIGPYTMKLPTYCNHQSEAQLSPGNIAFVIIVLFGISESIAPKDSVDMLRMNAVGPRIRIATRRKMNA